MSIWTSQTCTPTSDQSCPPSGAPDIIAGNQAARAGEPLRALELPADLVATSGEWGVAKPHPDFFGRVLAVSDASPENVLYVGDHPANDIGPAKAAGLRAAHLRRGPWGHLWADDPVAGSADLHIGALADLLPEIV